MNDGKNILGPWIRRFLLEYLANERNLSANTRSSYRDMLVIMLPYISKRLKKPIDKLLITDLSPDRLRDFLMHLEQCRQCSPVTRNQRLGALHALARYIGENSPEHIEWCSQVRLIPFRKTAKKSITYLEKPEMNALLAIPDQTTSLGYRDYSLLLFLYNSGARADEAAKLTIKDIDWYAHSVKFIGKGNKQRICPLWSATLAHLNRLSGKGNPEKRVFLNRLGKPMTRFGVHAIVERNALRAIKLAPSLTLKHVTPHVIRHTTATHLLRAGVDINTIRAWLGHVSINTTKIYAETDLSVKARALEICAPEGEQTKIKTTWKNQPDLMKFLHSL
jgi:integrase/recombinase XerD